MLAGGLAVLAAAWGRACAGDTCPSIAELSSYDPDQASKVYAADGRLITDLGLQRRTVVPLSEMSPAVMAAFLAIEDKRFYEHHGIDWFRVFGAVKSNVTQMRMAEGFSTITMQLAGNLFPENISGRDVDQAEAARGEGGARDRDALSARTRSSSSTSTRSSSATAPSAWRPRRSGTSASRSSDLNVAEAATLAAIPKAPSRYNPRKNPNLASSGATWSST